MALASFQAEPLGLDSNWSSVSLERFSYAESSKDSTKHQWHHDSRRDGLFLVFKPVRESCDGGWRTKVWMSVYAGAAILESQDICNLVEVAKRYETLRGQGRVDTADEAPVRVVVRSPMIAIKLPLQSTSTTVRRIQMRFKNNEDYQKTLEFYSQFKLPITEAASKAITPNANQHTDYHHSQSKNLTRQAVFAATGMPSGLCPKPENSLEALGETSSFSSVMMKPPTTTNNGVFKTLSLSSDSMRPSSVLSMSDAGDMRGPDGTSTLSSLLRETLVRSGSAADRMRHSSPMAMNTVVAQNQFDPVSASPLGSIPSDSSGTYMGHISLKNPGYSSNKRSFDASSGVSDISSAASSSHRQRIGQGSSVVDTVDRSNSIFAGHTPNEAQLPAQFNNDQTSKTELLRYYDTCSRSRSQGSPGHAPSRHSHWDLIRLADDRWKHPSLYFTDNETSSSGPLPLRRSIIDREDTNSFTHDHEFSSSIDHPGIGAQDAISDPQWRHLTRPASAPSHHQNSMAYLMPPRRELPFPVKSKPKPTPEDLLPISKNLTPSGSKNVPVIEGPSAIPAVKVKETKKTTAKRTSKKAGQQKALTKNSTMQVQDNIPTHRDEEVSPLATKSAAAELPPAVPGLRSKVTASRKRSSNSTVEFDLPNKQPRQMMDQTTQTRTLSGREHTSANVPASDTDRPASAVSDKPTSAISNITLPTVPEEVPLTALRESVPIDFVGQIEAAVFAHNAQSHAAPQELWERPGYNDSSAEERQNVINDFICENLENENFIKLCEDTGEVWRRIGLEM